MVIEKQETEDSLLISPDVCDTVNEDGAVLLDIKHGICFNLNPLGAMIWVALKDGYDRDHIRDTLLQNFSHVPSERIIRDMNIFIADLRKKRLLQ